MAINPELQYICEHQILNSDVVLITNVRPDHIGDMGNTLDELALALAKTIPSKGHLIINDDTYLDLYQEESKKYDCTIHIAKEYDGDDLDTFKDNIAIALEVARVLKLDEETFFNGMKNYKHDKGAYREIVCKDTLFMNALSVNDPESIKIVYDKVTSTINKEELVVVLCTREDRFTRTQQYLDLALKFGCKSIYITERSSYQLFKKNKIEVKFLKDYNELLNEKYVFATGNIIGAGQKLLKFFDEVGEKHGF